MREDGKVGSKRTFVPDEGIKKKLCPVGGSAAVGRVFFAFRD